MFMVKKMGTYVVTMNMGVAWRLMSFRGRREVRTGEKSTYLARQHPTVCSRQPIVSRMPQDL